MNTAPDVPATLAALQQQLAEQDHELQTLRAEIASLRRHDPLTGVMNRRTLLEMLHTELQRAHRTGHPFCFAIIDLDHFKTVNEVHGEAAGDLVLKNIAEAFVKLLRAPDRFGRMGGEEFGIVMPATWLDSGMIAIRRLREAMAACDWDAMTPGMMVTFSAGLTTNATGDSAEQILQRAETALLQAKLEGRNRTILLEENLPEMLTYDD